MTSYSGLGDQGGDAPFAPKLAVVMLGDGGVVTGWGAGAQALLGYTAGEVVGHPVAELLPEGAPAESLSMTSDAPGGAVRSIRASMLHRNGRSVLMDVAVEPVGPPAVAETRWVLVALPVEPDRGGGDPLLLARAVKQVPLAVGVHDAELRFVAASDELRRLLALPDEQALRGRRLSELHPDVLYREVEKRMERVVRTGEASVREVRHTPPGDTTARSWVVWFSPLLDARGRVSGVCATMIDDTDRYRARTSLNMLIEAGTRVGTSLDVTKTAQELTEVIVPRFADLATVDLLDTVLAGREPPLVPLPLSVRLRRVAHRADLEEDQFGARLDELQTYPDYSPPARCLAAGHGLLSGSDDPGFTRWVSLTPQRTAGAYEYGMSSMIAVPLRARGAVLGVLMCIRNRPERFTEGHLQVAEELAARAALSLDNARRYTRERETAVLLQQSLLPHSPPELAAVDVASRYLPFLPDDAEIGVGGDWFDVIPLSGSRVALAVGDVVGHGVHASATMARLRGAVRTLADVDLPPDELLTHLDDIVTLLSAETGEENIAGSGDGETGATCLYTVYDPVSRRYTMASAGHPPPVVVRPGAVPAIPDVPIGPPLGVGGVPFESTEVELEPGSILVLYTDGLIETRQSDLDEGLARLCRTVTGTGTGTGLENFCDKVLDEMLITAPDDDVALLIARTHALPQEHVASWDVPVDPAAVGALRTQALRRLAEWHLDDLAFTTELIVSELVTNAILYGRPPIRLRLILHRSPRRQAEASGDTLVCEVYDASETAPHIRRAHILDEGGRGLMLVAAVTQRWGSRSVRGGKTIWCEQHVAFDTRESSLRE